MRVAADASPIHYLVLLGKIDFLERMFGRVVVPSEVADELRHPNAPKAVRDFLAHPPRWLGIREAPPELPFAGLGLGESAAIRLSLSWGADLLLIDDRRGVEATRQKNLVAAETIALLERAAAEGWIPIEEAFQRLRETNFRVRPTLLDERIERVHSH